MGNEYGGRTANKVVELRPGRRSRPGELGQDLVVEEEGGGDWAG